MSGRGAGGEGRVRSALRHRDHHPRHSSRSTTSLMGQEPRSRSGQVATGGASFSLLADSWDVSSLVTFCPRTLGLGTFGPAAIPAHPEDFDRRNPKNPRLGRHTWRSRQCGSVAGIPIATTRPVRRHRTCCRPYHVKSYSIPPFGEQENFSKRRKDGWDIDRLYGPNPKLHNRALRLGVPEPA